MKKIIIYVLSFIILCFLIPVVFTKVNDNLIIDTSLDAIDNDVNINNNENLISINQEEGSYDYKDYKRVRLLHTKLNTVEEIDLDTYLYGVVSAEMPASFDMEALKAQAVVARTYTIYKIQNNNRKT